MPKICNSLLKYVYLRQNVNHSSLSAMKKLFLLSYTVLLSVFSAQGESVLLSCERVPFDDKILESKVWDVNVQSVIDENSDARIEISERGFVQEYAADDAERLKLVGVSVDGGKEGLIEYIYAACGKPSVVRSGWRSKKANPDGAISILGQVDNYLSARHDYSYNEQGWPTKTVTTLPMEFGLFVPDISSGFYRAAALDSIVKPDFNGSSRNVGAFI